MKNQPDKLFCLGDIALDKEYLHVFPPELHSSMYVNMCDPIHLLLAKLSPQLLLCSQPHLHFHVGDANSVVGTSWMCLTADNVDDLNVGQLGWYKLYAALVFLPRPCFKETDSKCFSEALCWASYQADRVANLKVGLEKCPYIAMNHS